MTQPFDSTAFGAPPDVQDFLTTTVPRPPAPAPAPHVAAAPPAPAPLASPEGLTAAMDAPFPQDPRGAADRVGGAPGGDPFPMDPRGAADRQPAMVPVTQTESSTQTTGPDAATAKNINAATGEANKAAEAAGTAKVGELHATADFERKEAQGQYGRGVNDFFTRAGELKTQDEIIRETSAALEDAAKFKPDRTALFSGDNGTLFGISAAVAAMAGGWLMG